MRSFKSTFTLKSRLRRVVLPKLPKLRRRKSVVFRKRSTYNEQVRQRPLHTKNNNTTTNTMSSNQRDFPYADSMVGSNFPSKPVSHPMMANFRFPMSPSNPNNRPFPPNAIRNTAAITSANPSNATSYLTVGSNYSSIASSIAMNAPATHNNRPTQPQRPPSKTDYLYNSSNYSVHGTAHWTRPVAPRTLPPTTAAGDADQLAQSLLHVHRAQYAYTTLLSSIPPLIKHIEQVLTDLNRSLTTARAAQEDTTMAYLSTTAQQLRNMTRLGTMITGFYPATTYGYIPSNNTFEGVWSDPSMGNHAVLFRDNDEFLASLDQAQGEVEGEQASLHLRMLEGKRERERREREVVAAVRALENEVEDKEERLRECVGLVRRALGEWEEWEKLKEVAAELARVKALLLERSGAVLEGWSVLEGRDLV